MADMQEYVLRLSTEIDNVGVQKLMSIMDTNKMKALGLTAALTAATTAVYKWIESATKKEIELDKLAKKQSKSIQQTRAEKEALDQMGMSLNDIKKDAALKSIYDDLVKFNKEMQMPNASVAIEKVRQMQGAFWKLKSAVSYLVQSVGTQLLINLEKPIERITNMLSKGANWVKNNLTSIGTKITGYLTAFSKGIIGIVEGVGKIFNWINQLPDNVKNLAGTIASIFALIKTGPIGQIIAMITAAGDLIHDFENSQWNKENRENTQFWNDGKGGYTDKPTEFGAYQVPLMYENLWNYVEEFGTEDLPTRILESITEALNGAFTESRSYLVKNIFGDTESGQSGIIGDITNWLNDNSNTVAAFGDSIITFVRNCFTAAGAFAGSGAGTLFNILLGDGTIPDDILNDETTATAFATGLGTFINGVINKIKDGDSLYGAFKGSFKEGILGSIVGALIANISADEANGITIDWDAVGLDLTATGEAFLGIVQASLSHVTNLGSQVLQTIGTALQGSLSSDALTADDKTQFIKRIGGVIEAWGSDETISGGITTAIITAFSGGNLFESVAAGIVGAFTAAREKALKSLAEGTEWEGADIGVLEKEFGDNPNLWTKIFGNLGDAAGGIFTGLWEAICAAASGVNQLGSTLMTTLLKTIVNALMGAGENSDAVKESVLKELGDLDSNSVVGGIAAGLSTWLVSGNFWVGLITGLVDTLIAAQDKVGTEPGLNTLWDVLSGEASQLWDKILNIIYGPAMEDDFGNKMLDENGQVVRNYNKGLISVIEPLLYGTEEIVEREGKKYKTKNGGLLNWLLGFDEHEVDDLGNEIGDAIPVKGWLSKLWDDDNGGGIKSLFDSLAKDVVVWLDPVGEAIKGFFASLWVDIYNSLPQWIMDLLGFSDPNHTEFVDNGDGTFTIRKTTGEKDSSYEVPSETADIVKDAGLTVPDMPTFFGLRLFEENGLLPEGAEDWFEAHPNWIGPSEEQENATLVIQNAYATAISDAVQSGDARAVSYLLSLYDKHKNEEGKWQPAHNLGLDVGEYNRNGVPENYANPESVVDWAVSNGGGGWLSDFFESGAYSYKNYGHFHGLSDEGIENVYNQATMEGIFTGTLADFKNALDTVFKTLVEEKDWGYNNPYNIGDDWENVYGTSGKINPKLTFASAGGIPQLSEEQRALLGMPVGGKNASAEEPTEGVSALNEEAGTAAGSMDRAGQTVNELGNKAEVAGGHVSKFGELAGGAEGSVQTLGDAAGTAAGSMDGLTGAADHAASVLSSLNTGGEGRAAMGGRFDSPVSKRVAEAGTEYVIPVTKPDRAFSLILQLLYEMGNGMIKRVTDHFFGGSVSEGIYDMASGMTARVGKDFALGTSGTIGGSMGGLESALQNMQQSFTYNISAPVNITVQSSGANAKEIGTAAYDAAERRLMKTLRGAYA